MPTCSIRWIAMCLMLGLIRFGGHLPRGGYDVTHAGHEAEADSARLH